MDRFQMVVTFFQFLIKNTSLFCWYSGTPEEKIVIAWELDPTALGLAVLQLLQLLHDFGQLTDLALRLALRGIVTASHIDRARFLFLGTDNEYKVILRHLGVADLLVERSVRDIHVRKVPGVMELALHLFSIRHQGSSHRDHLHLARRQPKVPATSTVLRQDGDHALHRSEHGAMDNNWARKVRLFTATVAVLQIESLGQLEVELERGALVVSAETISDQDVDLGTVEGTITGVDGPWAAKAVEGVFQMLFCRENVQ